MSWYSLWRRVSLQIAQYRRNCHPSTPAWYETQRKTTHVVFWS